MMIQSLKTGEGVNMSHYIITTRKLEEKLGG